MNAGETNDYKYKEKYDMKAENDDIIRECMETHNIKFSCFISLFFIHATQKYSQKK